MAATVAQGALLSAIEMAAVRAFRDDPATAQNMADVMRTITLAAVMALLAGPAVAQQQPFYNERGQITRSASTTGHVTTFRDRSGRMTGTAERMRDGTTLFRDSQGRMTGSATAPRR